MWTSADIMAGMYSSLRSAGIMSAPVSQLLVDAFGLTGVLPRLCNRGVVLVRILVDIRRRIMIVCF
jgi:hypothetical protein